jgi:hypothetical protein
VILHCLWLSISKQIGWIYLDFPRPNGHPTLFAPSLFKCLWFKCLWAHPV